MYKFDNVVKASSVWPTAKDYEDKGLILGLLRGYNIEVKTYKGEIIWLSCNYIEDEPEDFFNDDFHLWMYQEHGWTPTGRITFRGYAYESYDDEIGECVVPCDVYGREIK